MDTPSAIKLANPRIKITSIERFHPVAPATTANVVTVPSIHP